MNKKKIRRKEEKKRRNHYALELIICKTTARRIEDSNDDDLAHLNHGKGQEERTEVQDNPLKPKVKLKVVKAKDCSEGT
ncbi:hypothetical protein Tco_0504956 [Tanacetum coccineum]